jgi:hypothetical protein
MAGADCAGQKQGAAPMRTIFTTFGLLIAAATAFAETTGISPQTPSDTPHQSPFACNRLALSAAARTRHFDELGPQLRRLRTGVKVLPNGFAFRFPADSETVRLIEEWAAGERLCCPFFDIDIRMEAEGGPIWMTLTGRAGIKDLVRAYAPDWVKP